MGETPDPAPKVARFRSRLPIVFLSSFPAIWFIWDFDAVGWAALALVLFLPAMKHPGTTSTPTAPKRCAPGDEVRP
jgi:hypothetical protein